jgi:quinohemoprotein amine dehydrogenase
MRKTPEGWVMTLFRMHQVHGLALDEPIRDQIVRYLSDTQGLAPSEALPARFALERRPNVQDLQGGPEMAAMCGRCHTLARSALQRRDADEWLKLAHMHLGQWASLEYQASSRDRPWWQIASTELPAKLGALYPFESAAWTDWQARPKANLQGTWLVVAHEPGGRDLYGTAEIARDESGHYSARYALSDTAGSAVSGESHAVVYTGYEWRGRGQLGSRESREVFAVSEDATRITGRWFDPEHSEVGGDWLAVRREAAPRVLAILPRAVQTGAGGVVTVIGKDLDLTQSVSFGSDVSAGITNKSTNILQIKIEVNSGADPGARDLLLKAKTRSASMRGPPPNVVLGAPTLALYRQIDRLEVTPGFGIARVGGGKVDPVTAQFEATASTLLPNGEYLPLGPVRAEWAAEPFDAEAKRSDDVKFAGQLDQKSGRFEPAAAGPNPAREYSGNNAGNLAIVARVKSGERSIEGRSHLIVTVQRWINPPIY